MIPLNLTEISAIPPPRWSTNIVGFDKVLGGGIVKGSTMIVSGIPGAGKSTLLLQLASKLANQGKKIIYASGEENDVQIKMRAERLGINSENIILFPSTEVEKIIHAKFAYSPDLIIVDSLQMLSSTQLHSAPGSPSQVRNGLLKINSMAKENNVCVIFVGQSTKGGFIAGLQSYQHTVDTVLYLGIDENNNRFLEAKKNRFGQVGEVWQVVMTNEGLVDSYNQNSTTSSSDNYDIKLTQKQLDKILETHPLWNKIVRMSLYWLQKQQSKT